VVRSFETLMSEGHPQFRNYWTAMSGAEAIDARTVRFTFSEADNPELPVIIGQVPVLPKHFWESRTFGETTLDPLLGSGPYRFGKIDAGRSLTYEVVEDYWGRDLPVNVGKNNFDLRYDYYRDTTVGLEALKAGDSDFRLENIAKNWATAYDFPALASPSGAARLAAPGGHRGTTPATRLRHRHRALRGLRWDASGHRLHREP